ncbi:MAG: hypothetical protein DRI26_07525 [Chloroflexi bacterium]|nr:MAG: hypothetical protein DRI26_07525 [Chloroflexota bacterium]
MLKPWYGPERCFNYLKEVQCVFDRYCISCHDFGRKGAGKIVLASDLTLAFNVSYMELRGKGYVNVVGAGPAEVLPPYSWGSHKSRLVNVLLSGHHGVQLDKESFDRIVTWIDINAPYYPEYASSYPENLYGRSPLDNKELRRLSQLVGIDLMRQHSRPYICFDRPNLSPCLKKFSDKNDPKYREGLAIISGGSERLKNRPRMEMPGARLFGIEALRQRNYDRLVREEKAARKALSRGEKYYAR